ncbi:MAG: hypothetical protein ACLQVI_28990 [Polyangiaceae bacterium]
MASEEKDTEQAQAAPPSDPLESIGISRRRLAYAAPAILLSRKMIYRATACGKQPGVCRSNRRAS